MQDMCVHLMMLGDQGISLGRGGVGDSKYPNHGSRVERGAPGLRRRAPGVWVRLKGGEDHERLNVPV